jgi:hypothetical protein
MEILIFSAFFVLIIKLSVVYFRNSVKKVKRLFKLKNQKVTVETSARKSLYPPYIKAELLLEVQVRFLPFYRCATIMACALS